MIAPDLSGKRTPNKLRLLDFLRAARSGVGCLQRQAISAAQPSMSATFLCLANTNFCTLHQAPRSGSGLPSVAADSGFRASNSGVLSVQTQPFVLFPCAVSRPLPLRLGFV